MAFEQHPDDMRDGLGLLGDEPVVNPEDTTPSILNRTSAEGFRVADKDTAYRKRRNAYITAIGVMAVVAMVVIGGVLFAIYADGSRVAVGPAPSETAFVVTATQMPSLTSTLTRTPEPSVTPLPILQQEAAATDEETPTQEDPTDTATPTGFPSRTSTYTPSPTMTPSATATNTGTATLTATMTESLTPLPTLNLEATATVEAFCVANLRQKLDLSRNGDGSADGMPNFQLPDILPPYQAVMDYYNGDPTNRSGVFDQWVRARGSLMMFQAFGGDIDATLAAQDPILAELCGVNSTQFITPAERTYLAGRAGHTGTGSGAFDLGFRRYYSLSDLQANQFEGLAGYVLSQAGSGTTSFDMTTVPGIDATAFAGVSGFSVGFPKIGRDIPAGINQSYDGDFTYATVNLSGNTVQINIIRTPRDIFAAYAGRSSAGTFNGIANNPAYPYTAGQVFNPGNINDFSAGIMTGAGYEASFFNGRGTFAEDREQFDTGILLEPATRRSVATTVPASNGNDNAGNGNNGEATTIPGQPTNEPVEPTDVHVQPTDVHVQPTDVIVQPTSAPVPTSGPVMPTDAPVQPTDVTP